ncbi:unnamed protein product, partial [Ectocarpus sp. 12 AP-2014]
PYALPFARGASVQQPTTTVMGHNNFDSNSEMVASASSSSSRLLHVDNNDEDCHERMRRQCQHMKITPDAGAATAALGQEGATQPTTGRPCSEDASVTGTRDTMNEGGGMAQLEAELREAKARASNAEDLSREREEACERLRQEIARLERRASDGFRACSAGTASPPPPAVAARMEAEGMMAPTACEIQHHNKDDSITVSTTATTATTNTRTSSFARPRPSSAAAAAAEAAAVAAAVAAAASARAEIPDMQEARPLPPDHRVETGAATGRHAHDQRRAAAASAAGAAAAAATATAATVGGRGGSGGAPDVPPYRGPLSVAPLLPPSSSPTGLLAEAGSRGGGRFMPGSAPAPGVATSFGGATKEDTRQRRAKSMSPRQAQERAYLPYDGARPIEIPVGREDEGLLLGGGRVLHKLKEELGGTLEYRRSHGVVFVYGQQGGPRKAAACVRTALLLRNGRGEPTAEKYDLARLCMDDLLAECIALKGLKQAGTASPGTSSISSAATCPASYSDGGGSEGSCSPGTDPWSPIQAAAAAATPSVSSSVSSSSSSFAPPDNGRVAAAIAAAAAVTVASNLPDGEYPPETSSLRIIGEKFGCVIDVVGEAAAAAAAAAVNASAAACEGGRGGAGADPISPLQAVGSATPVGHQDILIWGPAGVVGEAKDAVCSLVSGSAAAEVVVGVGRIARRDRGFWVNCE